MVHVHIIHETNKDRIYEGRREERREARKADRKKQGKEKKK
jgi:hypothetical protein